MMFWDLISYLTLVGEAVMLVLAIWLYRIRRTGTFAFLMCACVSFVIARSSWFTFGFAGGYLVAAENRTLRATVERWHEYTNFTFQLLFVLLMIAALVSFIRERSG